VNERRINLPPCKYRSDSPGESSIIARAPLFACPGNEDAAAKLASPLCCSVRAGGLDSAGGSRVSSPFIVSSHRISSDLQSSRPRISNETRLARSRLRINVSFALDLLSIPRVLEEVTLIDRIAIRGARHFAQLVHEFGHSAIKRAIGIARRESAARARVTEDKEEEAGGRVNKIRGGSPRR